ncbi:hypothetical protein GTW73_21870, partial [Streptomyces sp. SID4982]|nr:hypothetical protein [Streptomyces sp. SID4982]
AFAPPLPSAEIPDDGDDAIDEGPIEGEFVDDEPGQQTWPAAAQPPTN